MTPDNSRYSTDSVEPRPRVSASGQIAMYGMGLVMVPFYAFVLWCIGLWAGLPSLERWAARIGLAATAGLIGMIVWQVVITRRRPLGRPSDEVAEHSVAPGSFECRSEQTVWDG